MDSEAKRLKAAASDFAKYFASKLQRNQLPEQFNETGLLS